MREQNGRVYSFDDFQLDAANRQLLRGETKVSLPARAFDLLVALVESSGRLVEKDELFNSVWHDQIVEESNLTVHVSQIRKALGENRNKPRYIETVPGYGYRFVGEVQTAENDELVIETETLSRITIESEIEDGPEPGAVSWSPNISIPPAEAAGSLAGTEYRRPYTKLAFAAGTFAILAIVVGFFWLSNRDLNSVALPPAVLPEKQANIRRLTSKGNVNRGVLSPDGRFFAYSLQERGAYRSSLWLRQTSGTSDVQLLPGADLTYNPRSFSADGNWLYYTVSEPRGFDNGTLYKMPVLGGVPQKLLSGISVYAVVSPDEKEVAFVRGSRENKTGTLVIAGLYGSGTRQINERPATEGSFHNFSLSWSPDGSMVAFGAESGNDKSNEIFTINTSSGEVRQITTLEWIGISRIEWLRDGSGLFAVARDKNSLGSGQVWQIDHQSGKAQNITRDLQHYGSTLSLSADSSSLLAIQSILESHIWIAPADNLAAARQISFGSSGIEGWHGIEWIPDGRIVYTARIDQSLMLWTMDADGANAKQITSAGFLDQRPSVTADGKFIVFQSNRSGSADIWRVNPDGADLRQLTFDGRNSFPHSTPDGKTVVYTHNADGTNSAWRISIEGGEATQITDAESFNARVSPDGNFIACGYVEAGKTKLAIVPITGGRPLKLFDVPPTYNFDGSIRWTRDGRSITYRDWANGVWQQSIDGDRAKRLEGLPAEKLLHFDWSPDGKHLAFTRGRDVRDVVLITNLK